MPPRFRVLTTRFGHLGIVGDGHGLHQLYLPQPHLDRLIEQILHDYPTAREDDRLLPGLIDDLRRYFAGQPVEFSTPVHCDGASSFAQAAWQACRQIPYGQTVSYRELAERIGRPGAARAVGQAMRNNPCPIVIPCHRVLRSDGSLGGYVGNCGVQIKRRLLELEATAGQA